MDLSAIGARIAAGMLPHANDVTARHVRNASGVCVGCDVSFGGRDVGVQIFVSGKRRCLHADCYVMWMEACGDVLAAMALCKVCGEAIKGGTPRYSLGSGPASVHVECRDTIKPEWPRANEGPSRPGAGDARTLQDGQGSLLAGGALDNAHTNNGTSW